MSCKVWKSYFQFSHKGNTLLHILTDSEHVAEWLREGFVSLGMHFIGYSGYSKEAMLSNS